MKVLQVVHCFPPYFHAGAENYAYNISRELSRRHEVFVYCRDYPILGGPLIHKDEVFEGLRVRRIRTTQPETYIRSFFNEEIHENFSSYLLEVNPDIVHFQHLIHLSVSCIDEVVRQRIPFVMTLHDYFYICPQVQMMKPRLTMCRGPYGAINCIGCEQSLLKNYKLERFSETEFKMPVPIVKRLLRPFLPRHPVARLKERFLDEYYPIGEFPYRRGLSFMRLQYILSRLEKADLIIAPSRYLAEKYREAGVDEKKMVVSSYGMDHRLFEGFARKPRGARIRFSFIGTITAHKGLHVLIKAFNAMPADAAELNIFGDYNHMPDYTKFLRQEAKHPHINFRGKFPPRQVAEPYSETDVLVVPSLWHENCPLVLHDAFITKTPVIVSGGGAMDEFVQDGENGLLFRMGDSQDLAEKMMFFIREPHRIKEMGRRAPAVKTVAEDARDLEKRYAEILAGGAR